MPTVTRIGPLRPILEIANVTIARQVVARIIAFRTTVPFGRSWEQFAVAEVLTNAVKHAQAGRIVVAVADQDGQLTAEVTDDGIGGSKISPGGGLAGLVDRLSAVGGGLALESAMPGTQARLWVPLQ